MTQAFTTLETKAFFEIVVRKGENAGNQCLLLFPLCFQPFQETHPINLLCTKQQNSGLDQI